MRAEVIQRHSSLNKLLLGVLDEIVQVRRRCLRQILYDHSRAGIKEMSREPFDDAHRRQRGWSVVADSQQVQEKALHRWPLG